MAKSQLEVLSALDLAKTQLYHFTAIVIAGMGFFTHAYDLFCISLVTKLLGRIYWTTGDKPGSLPPNVAASVNGLALVGTLVGQLFFGWLGEKMERYARPLYIPAMERIHEGLTREILEHLLTTDSVFQSKGVCTEWRRILANHKSGLLFGVTSQYRGDDDLTQVFYTEHATKED